MNPLIIAAKGGTGEVFLIGRRLFLTGMLALTGLTIVPTSGSAQATASPPTTASAATGSFQVHTSDGLTLAAYAQGDPASPEILLIHGLGQCYLSWERQLRDPALAGFRVVSFDLRGHGDSDKPDNAAAYADGKKWGDDVAAVIAAAGLRRPVLVGWSLGGAVMLSYLKQHGTKHVAGIDFVDAVTGFGPDLMRPASKDFAARLGSKDLNVRSDAIATCLRACFATPPSQNEDRMIAYNGMVPRVLHQALKISDEGFDKVIQTSMGRSL